jgi:hypothetical protein
MTFTPTAADLAEVTHILQVYPFSKPNNKTTITFKTKGLSLTVVVAVTVSIPATTCVNLEPVIVPDLEFILDGPLLPFTLTVPT